VLAIADREAIFDHIAEDSPESAVRVDEGIEAQVALLASSPKLGRPGRIVETRELVIAHSPYVIAYGIASDRVTILRVLHGAQCWPSEF
jgi:toxin ParE1/3/4